MASADCWCRAPRQGRCYDRRARRHCYNSSQSAVHLIGVLSFDDRFASRPFQSRPQVQTGVGMNFNAKIWTVAGGYTLLNGDWGNFDVIAGFRYLGIPIGIDFNLGIT